MTAPSPFSSVVPRLQIVWDATSLKALMECPRKYLYSIILGYKGTGVDIEFGGFFASAMEHYSKERLNGKGKEASTISTLRQTLRSTWRVGDNTAGPWGGRYEEQWRCLGEQPFRNGRGNRAKCPWAHKGHWFPGPAPHTCGSCGSGTHAERRWQPDDKVKNRITLVRLVLAYCDAQTEQLGDGLSPWAFPNGTPAVELPFRLPLPWTAPTGERYILAGYLDAIKTFGDEKFITDNKTTKKQLDAGYWAGFAPNVQVDTYDLTGATLYEELDIKGVIIEGAQTLMNGANFGIGIFRKSDALRAEYLEDIEFYLRLAEKFAKDNHWPMNRSACYLCQFKGVCTMHPDKRARVLEENFRVQHWNPLEER